MQRAFETISQGTQAPYFALDGPKMSHDQLAGKSTGRLIPRGFDQLTDFIERESKRLRSTDELKQYDSFGAVDPIPIRRASRRP